MTTLNPNHSDFFIRATAAFAMLGPIVLIIVANTLPEGLARGELIVTGHIGIVVTLAIVALLRSAYVMGFSKAFKVAAAQPSRSVNA
jgi:threonine/homoserine/homoserine lactone efflux protein